MMAKYSYPITVLNLTKKFKDRERIVANEYNKVVNDNINRDLPQQLKINFIHYDVKANKKQEPNFPKGLFNIHKKALEQSGFFSVAPQKTSKLSKIQIQRGVVRTNCIDSLDRTNFAQELLGYTAVLE